MFAKDMTIWVFYILNLLMASPNIAYSKITSQEFGKPPTCMYRQTPLSDIVDGH